MLSIYPFSHDEIVQYTKHDCWVLARALGELTGWTVVGVGINNAPTPDTGYRDFGHLAVKTAHGRILDIEGNHSPTNFLRRWTGYTYNQHSKACRDVPCTHSTVLFEVQNTKKYWTNLLDDIDTPFEKSVREASLTAQRLLSYYIDDHIERTNLAREHRKSSK